MPTRPHIASLLRRLVPDPDRPPPGPFRPGFWRSPLRSPRLTAMLGLVLLIGLPVVAVTGLFSNDAYQPGLGTNALGRDVHGPLDFYLFHWPAGGPSWLYALSQGAHVTLGLALFPVVLAKLWSVIPKLFEWPPVRSPAHALERLTLAFLVGGALFEFVTGILNIQYWYAFKFDFPQAHYYGGWVFIGALIAHISIKFPTMAQNLRTRERVLAGVAGTAGAGVVGQAHGATPVLVPVAIDADAVPSDARAAPTCPIPFHAAHDGLTSPNPKPESMSRRALVGSVAAASGILFLQGIGQSVGGPLRALAFLLPRGATRPGPLGFPVNRTWELTGLKLSAVADANWRLKITGERTVTLSRQQLLAMPQYTHELTIGCVEGWSTTQHWTGVRMVDLARLVGADVGAVSATNISLAKGAYGQATLAHQQVSDDHTLVALKVNGHTLPLDHGYPARVIASAIPGVHCTKWITEIQFDREAT